MILLKLELILLFLYLLEKPLSIVILYNDFIITARYQGGRYTKMIMNNEQAWAELCQAQAQLGYPTSKNI